MTDWNSHALPHGIIRKLAPRLWHVTGSLPRGRLPRNMVIHKLEEGGLWIHSPIALKEESMQQLEALGPPTVLVIPNGLHRRDAAAYKRRFPKIKVVCPEAARKRVEKVVPVDGNAEDMLPPLSIRCHKAAGVRPSELVYEISSGEGTCLVFTDLLFNLKNLGGFDGWLLKFLGSTGFFGMTGLGRMLMLQDRQSFRSWLEKIAQTPRLNHICVGHGEPVQNECSAHLLGAAARLSS